MRYADFYGYPYYWGGMGIWGDGMYVPMVPPAGVGQSPAAVARREAAQHANDDPHLRSCQAVVGYHIHASDGDIGHVAGMLVDEETWALRYLVVDTTNWWGGHQVLIAPKWIESISWDASKVNVNLNRQSIMDSPRYESTAELNRQYEMDLYRHYQRSAYWDTEPGTGTAKIHSKQDL
jgi:hypothetical protein